ncbi:MAG TPA: hypothetical protein VFY17_04525 [Pilimelia sp.]|nr:hypothetical protein [Pilimelia sp.]
MTPAPAVAAAATLVWLGMVLAISFLEAPLRFRAPGVTLPIGLGIGRIVFRALNAAEAVLAALVATALATGVSHPAPRVAGAVAVGLLVAQLAAVRPRLTRRSDRVLAGGDAPRSASHHVYIAMEVAKVIALVCLGTLLLTA